SARSFVNLSPISGLCTLSQSYHKKRISICRLSGFLGSSGSSGSSTAIASVPARLSKSVFRKEATSLSFSLAKLDALDLSDANAGRKGRLLLIQALRRVPSDPQSRATSRTITSAPTFRRPIPLLVIFVSRRWNEERKSTSLIRFLI